MKTLFKKLPAIPLIHALSFLVISIIVMAVSLALKPNSNYLTFTDNLENVIPREFADWSLEQQQIQQVSLVSDNKLQNQIYDDVLMRTYTNKQGHKVMLALAYVKEQRQDVKVHQPDICYPAQGFEMLRSELAKFNISANASAIVGKNQLFKGSSQMEAVSYWIRVGDGTFLSGLQMRLKIIRDGLLNRRFDDGMLVRVSSTIRDDSNLTELFKTHEKFLNDLTNSVSGNSRKLLVPSAI